MRRNFLFAAVVFGGMFVIDPFRIDTVANESVPNAFVTSPPNIVFIMADDLGWANVGFHGGDAPTPHLDKLAADGLELAAHYCAPVCSPTRTGLMTGRCWSRFDVTNAQNQQALPRDTVTLPLALKSAGYETCLTGKWHLGSRPEQGPNQFGFDHSYGSLAGGVSPWKHGYKKGPFERTWHRNETLLDEEGHVTDLIASEAVRWIEGRGTKPFLLYVPFTAVHLPVNEPQEWLNRVPASVTRTVDRHYLACVMHLDDAVGEILAALDAKGVRDHTLVVFTSDNGGSWAENNDERYPAEGAPSGKLSGDNVPWRGEKTQLYEGGTRVPCLASWPGRIRSGKVDSRVQIIDWMPTLCSLAGVKPAEDLLWDGTDISRLLLSHEPLPERTLYAVGPNSRARSVWRGDWKLIEHIDNSNRLYELFNLATDPAETKNLANSHSEQRTRLLNEMNRMAARDGDRRVSD